jgi:hypothetical protein
MLHTSIQGSGEHPAFPAQWLYGLYDFVLVTGFLATIIGIGFRFRRLDASTGASDPNDFTVRCSSFVSRAAASTAPRPNVCDDGLRPLCPENLAGCANGRFSQNRPLLELSPLRPKAR